jgi:hypothetical protein
VSARSGFLDEATLPDAALAYAGMGWPVFPLKPGDKVPLIPKAEGGNGVHDATTDPDQIREWWERQPDANIGVAAGVASWTLDLDFAGFLAEEPDGADTFLALERRFGRMPETVRQQTGGLGWQRFFAPDPRIRNGVKLLPGLDTRAAGGYVAAPPSVHPSGRRYRWIVPPGEAELAQAPEWLVALLEPVELPEPVPPPRPARVGDLSRYAAAAVDKAGERVAAASGRAAVRHAGARGVRARPAGRGRGAAPRRGQGRAGRGRAAHALGHRPGQARQALQAVDQARGRVARRPGAGRRRGQAPDPGGPAMSANTADFLDELAKKDPKAAERLRKAEAAHDKANGHAKEEAPDTGQEGAAEPATGRADTHHQLCRAEGADARRRGASSSTSGCRPGA